MTKNQLLRELLARVGDPQGNSDTFAGLAWSLFIETLYQALPSLQAVEKSSYLSMMYMPTDTDTKGVARVSPDWHKISGLVGVSLITPEGSYPSSVMNEEEYRAVISNPYYEPMIPAAESSYYLDNKDVVVATGIRMSEVIVGLAVFTDLRTALDVVSGEGELPLHNSIIYSVMPAVSEKLKKEVGLVL